MSDMGKAELAQSIEINFIAACQSADGINGASFRSDSFSTRCFSNYQTAWMNLVLKADGDADDLVGLVAKTLEEYATPMLWRVGPATTNGARLSRVLQQSGLTFSSTEPALCLSMKKFKRSEDLSELRIEEVLSPRQVDDFLVPFCDGFSVPDDVAEHFRLYGIERVVPMERQQWFVAYCDEQPVACVTWYACGGINMIYNVCTVEQYRRRGFARRMVDLAVEASLSKRDLPVCLYSSPLGLSLYKSIGFEEVFVRTDYMYEPDALLS